MPVIKNKVTGKTRTVTEEELQSIQKNDMTKNLYSVSKTEEPAEVTAKKADDKGSKPAEEKSK